MAAAHKNPKLRSLPMHHGMLSATGVTVDGPRPSDGFDVFLDSEGDLVVVILDVPVPADSPGSVLGSLLQQARVALESRQPLHLVVGQLELQLAARPGLEAGFIVLRISQREAKVEVLNAGMPAIANALPGGRLELHPALSSPIGRRFGEVHPYELVPLIWGGAWLAVSDGMTAGSLESQSVIELCSSLQLENRGMSLAAATSDALYDAVQDALPAAHFLRDDATCVIVGADVHGLGRSERFQSGIESH